MAGTSGNARSGRLRGPGRLAFVTVLLSSLAALLGAGTAAAAATATAAARPPTEADVSIDLPATVSGYLGAPIWLSVSVANAGPASATGIHVTLEFPSGLSPTALTCTDSGTGSTCTYSIGSLAAGLGAADILELRASAAGSYTVRGQVTADQADPNTANNVDTAQVEVTESSDVSIDLPATAQGYVGAPIFLPVSVANAGPSTATGIQVTLEFPTGLSPVDGTCTATGAVLTCTYANGSLPPNTGGVMLLMLEASAAGSYTVRGQVSADQPDPNTANNADSGLVEVTSSADIAVQVTDSADPVMTGQPLTYTVTVSNHGPSPASAISLVDTWSAATRGSAALISVAVSQGGCVSVTPDRVECQLGSLASGASATLTVRLRPRGTGLVTDQASASAPEPDPDLANNSDQETTTVLAG
jgi:uncharacterized repeat protein (TIGR01451 family)